MKSKKQAHAVSSVTSVDEQIAPCGCYTVDGTGIKKPCINLCDWHAVALLKFERANHHELHTMRIRTTRLGKFRSDDLVRVIKENAQERDPG
jgi:hypothetical protein